MLALGYFVQDLHGLHRFYHNVDHSGIKLSEIRNPVISKLKVKVMKNLIYSFNEDRP